MPRTVSRLLTAGLVAGSVGASSASSTVGGDAVAASSTSSPIGVADAAAPAPGPFTWGGTALRSTRVTPLDHRAVD